MQMFMKLSSSEPGFDIDAQHAAAADPRFATKTAQGTKASSFAPRGQALAKAQSENAGVRF
jgi:hypothetical protein